MRSLLLLLGFSILIGACSNPFSGRSDSILRENPKPENSACSDVRFDQADLTGPQFRAVIRCLNQSHELEAIEQWSLTVSDAELSPWISQFNSVLKQEPAFLYALKEAYVEQRGTGAFQNLLTQFFSKLRVENRSRESIALIKKHSKWIREFVSNPNYKINTGNIALLPEVKSFTRTVDEQWRTDKLSSLLEAVARYRRSADALSFQQLFDFFDATSSLAISKQESAEQIAGFINWLLSDGRLDVFSHAAETLSKKPLHCFEGDKIVADSLNVVLSDLRAIDPSTVADFFQTRISRIVLLGQAYCGIPAEVLSAATLLQESSKLKALPQFFGFIQPLLSDPRFLSLLGSSSFRELAKDLSAANGSHFFQDLITLVAWFQKNPVSEMNTARLLDSIFDEFTPQEMILFTKLIPEDARVFQTVHQILEALPKLQNTVTISVSRDWLAPLSKDSFAPVLSLLVKMNDENKIIPIVDRVLDLFQKMLDRGKPSYQKRVAVQPVHSVSSDSQTWQISFIKNVPTAGNAFTCADLSLRWDYSKISGTSSKAYLQQLDRLSYCFGSNRSFRSLSDLAKDLLQRDPSGDLLQKLVLVEKDLFRFLFATDVPLAFNMMDQFLQLNEQDRLRLHVLFTAGSSLISASKYSLVSASATRALVAKYISKSDTIAAISEQWEKLPAVDSTERRAAALAAASVKAIANVFDRHCPALDSASADCDIEKDQVDLYRHSPQKLAEKIIAEYFSSPQSWAHPLEFTSWNSVSGIPQEVSTIQYHLNPLLKQMQNNPAAAEGIFGFIGRNEKSDWKILQFLTEKSETFFLVPYVFQNSRYPGNGGHEFHRMIRLRLMNDIDRLELLAINADFMAFGLMKNFGMNFIREIATSWGDVPSSLRPKLGTSETLSMARASILSQFDRFNSSLLQRIGACDPRGRGRFGRWIQNHLCNGELSDIRARMFNLKILLPILDDDRALAVLRDLFYSLYEHNSEEQFGSYSNGVKDDPACLSPKQIDDRICSRDFLEMIPKIARLGLLHQAGISLLNRDTEAVKALIALLIQANHEGKNAEITSFFATAAGQSAVRDVLSLTMEMNSSEQKNLSTFMENASSLGNQQWLSFTLPLLKTNPNLLKDYAPTIHTALRTMTVNSFTPKMISLMTSISTELRNPRLAVEVSAILKTLTGSQPALQSLINSKLSVNFSTEWLKALSQPGKQKSRDQLSSFVTGKGLENFCDVFSDARLVEGTYNFLEASQQNPGIFDLLQECRRFLH